MLQGWREGPAGAGIPEPRRASALAVATALPSGPKATAPTMPRCDSGAPMGRPVATSHSRAPSLSLPVATDLPSGLKATARTVE